MNTSATTYVPAVSRTSIKVVFLLQAVASGSLFPRIPDLQHQLGIDASTLGLAFIGQPVGAMAMFLVAGRLIEGAGTTRVLAVGLPLLSLALFAMALAPSALLLASAIAVYAACFAVTNVAMNVEADRVEAATGRRLMNTCHGIWSIGQLAVFALGVLARGLGVSPLLHFGLVVPVIVIAALFVILPMAPAPPRDGAATVRRGLALPDLATLRILAFMLGGALVEGATRVWSVIYARDSFAAPDWAQALTLPLFVAGMALGRFLADGWSQRWGPTAVARVLLGLALVGLLMVVLAPALPVALIGFVVMGFGICTTFPASTSAAAQLPGRTSSESVAALTLGLTTIMIGVPPFMGIIADTFGIRATFGAVVPLVIVSLLVAAALEPRRRA